MTAREEDAAARGTRIQVYILPTMELDSAMFETLESLLDINERARAATFRFESHRREFIAAHGLKRRMLSEAMPAFRPKEWHFRTSATGKPETVQLPDLQFNLTHCSELVACATGLNVVLGLDAESFHRPFPDELLDTHFSAAERSLLARYDGDQHTEACFGLWTLKEAWAKASGIGITRALSQASFELVDPISVRFDVESVADSAEWHFRTWRLDTHVVSLGWVGPAREVRCQVLGANSLGILALDSI